MTSKPRFNRLSRGSFDFARLRRTSLRMTALSPHTSHSPLSPHTCHLSPVTSHLSDHGSFTLFDLRSELSRRKPARPQAAELLRVEHFARRRVDLDLRVRLLVGRQQRDVVQGAAVL